MKDFVEYWYKIGVIFMALFLGAISSQVLVKSCREDAVKQPGPQEPPTIGPDQPTPDGGSDE